MCDPLTLGTLAVGLAGTVANSVGQASAARKQESAYNAWSAQQDKNRVNENARQEEMRKKADIDRTAGLDAVSAERQIANQAAEEQRLAALMAEEPEGGAAPAGSTATDQAAADAAMLSGQQSGGDVFQTDAARSLADAASSAKSRIGAMATAASFGNSGSGLGTINPIAQQQAGQGIDWANNMRKGSLAAYGTEQAVDPKQITYSNPIADIASSFLGVGMQGVGNAMAPGGVGVGAGLKNMGGNLIGGGGSWAKTAASALKPRYDNSPGGF